MATAKKSSGKSAVGTKKPGKKKLKKQERELLTRFQCPHNQALEESFARTLAEKPRLRLFFVNNSQPYTDGHNIIVDPALFKIFADRKALDAIGAYLKWPPVTLADPWNVLRITTRAQTIHECLHLIYTKLPGYHVSDPRCDTFLKRFAMCQISNIIEDCYIEAVGAECYDNMEPFLQFQRLANLFATTPVEGTAARLLKPYLAKAALSEQPQEPQPSSDTAEDRYGLKKLPDKEKARLLQRYLNFMGILLKLPMVEQLALEAPLLPLVKDTVDLFFKGSLAATPQERYAYTVRIFECIQDLIPHDLPDDEYQALFNALTAQQPGFGTHSLDGREIAVPSEGRAQAVSGHLFTDAQGNLKPLSPNIQQLMNNLSQFARDRQDSEEENNDEGKSTPLTPSSLGASAQHEGITIYENQPEVAHNLKLSYREIQDYYQLSIRSALNKLKRLLVGRQSVPEEKQLFGAGISSARLGDVKKRYWYRHGEDNTPLDLAVLLLIDGSGSMYGARREAAVHCAVILHEVLRGAQIPHAVAEHRAVYKEPAMEINLLLSFKPRREEHFNLLKIDADGENRDALALLWSEKYLRLRDSEHKLIISISDGYPSHSYDDYHPPLSVEDTATTVRKIRQRGTLVVGIALDDPEDSTCYEALRPIYPDLVACDDLDQLPRQVLSIISRLVRDL